jgi:hypothetical protein
MTPIRRATNVIQLKQQNVALFKAKHKLFYQFELIFVTQNYETETSR